MTAADAPEAASRPTERHEGPTEWHAARKIAYQSAVALPCETVRLGHAAGRTLAGDLRALCSIPHYASSAMDGWAVSGPGPWRLVEPNAALRSGYASPIVTGGLIPDGCEAVIRSEDATEVERPEVGGGISSGIESLRSPRAGLNIRRVGEEAELGELLVGAGTTLNPVHLALAASGGIDAVAVRPRPRVAVILSGDEVVDSGIPGPGQVRDSFGLQFPALFGLLGSEVISVARVGDRLPDLSSALRSEAARSADLVVTTGGTGGSRVDLLRAALGELDSEVLVNGLAIRPGAPTLLVRRAGGGPLIGLPGNPLAAILGLLTLGPPILAGLIGDALPRTARVRIAAPIEGKPRLRLLPYRLHAGRASVTAWQGSAMLRGLADADGVLLCPPEGAQPGMELEALPLPWLGSADRWAAGPIEP